MDSSDNSSDEDDVCLTEKEVINKGYVIVPPSCITWINPDLDKIMAERKRAERIHICLKCEQPKDKSEFITWSKTGFGLKENSTFAKFGICKNETDAICRLIGPTGDQT